MNCNFHPEPETLVQYAAANLGPAHSMVIKLHARFCNICSSMIHSLESLGGSVLLDQENSKLSFGTEEMIALIKQQVPTPPPKTQTSPHKKVPFPITMDYILPYSNFNHQDWEAQLDSEELDVAIADPLYTSTLYKIRSGIQFPLHTHSGQEITILLAGGFSDKYGEYNTGDYIHRGPEDFHSPVMLKNTVCFAIFTGPIILS